MDPSSIPHSFVVRARADPRRIVLPEGEDQRVLAAADRLANSKLARPVVLVRAGAAGSILSGTNSANVEHVDPSRADVVEQYADDYVARRPGITRQVAVRLLRRPLFFGAAMVAAGDADAMVAGVTKPTGQVLASGALVIGYANKKSLASSFFLMVLPAPAPRILVYADAAVVVDPDARQLGEIAVTTANNVRVLLDIEPKVALLSFSTRQSAVHPRAEKVRQAVLHARALDPQLLIDGELQADAALSPAVASRKCGDSLLAGQANVLIFPDLDAGNIAYKLTQYLAGAQAIGPILQGFRRPINDLSRGATVEDIVDVATISVVQAQCTGS